MDRLPSIASLLLLLCLPAACENTGKSGSGESKRERVQAITSTQSRQDISAEFCDARPNKTFQPPPLADGKSFANTTNSHWVNLWASWCEPCVEEMPRLLAWQKKWHGAGLDVQLSFLSVDDDAALIEKFRSDHPEAPESLRVADVEQVKSWLATLGIAEMILPVHILVDAKGTVQCVRSSSVEDHDERSVKALLQ